MCQPKRVLIQWTISVSFSITEYKFCFGHLIRCSLCKRSKRTDEHRNVIVYSVSMTKNAMWIVRTTKERREQLLFTFIINVTAEETTALLVKAKRPQLDTCSKPNCHIKHLISEQWHRWHSLSQLREESHEKLSVVFFSMQKIDSCYEIYCFAAEKKYELITKINRLLIACSALLLIYWLISFDFVFVFRLFLNRFHFRFKEILVHFSRFHGIQSELYCSWTGSEALKLPMMHEKISINLVLCEAMNRI